MTQGVKTIHRECLLLIVTVSNISSKCKSFIKTEYIVVSVYTAQKNVNMNPCIFEMPSPSQFAD